MGTYTTNYNLFMPSVGEQGWGDLVNGNFTTIDTAMKSLDGRISTNASNISSLTTRMNTAENDINIIQNETQLVTPITNNSHISALKMGTDVTFISTATGTTSCTYTYKENPICNNVTFTCYANQAWAGSTAKPGRTYLQINGTIVADTGTTSYPNYGITKTYSTTLHDGDVIYGYITHASGASGSNDGSSYVKMTCTPYLMTK